MKVVIFGMGNVATFLFHQWLGSTIEIVGIGTRTTSNTTHFPAPQSICFHELEHLANLQADAIVLAVNDDAIVPLAQKIRSLKTTSLLLHCSGALQHDEELCDGYLWPVYSISKSQQYASNEVPVAFFSYQKNNEPTIKTLAQHTGTAFPIAPHQKPFLHVAATLSNNFIHHLLVHTAQIVDKHHIDRSLLQPILQQTIENFSKKNIAQLQTGAAVREDHGTMQQHLDLLQNHNALQQLYVSLSQSIIDLKRGK